MNHALRAGCLVAGAITYGAGDAPAADGGTYVLSVGQMEVAHDVNMDDSWSPARPTSSSASRGRIRR